MFDIDVTELCASTIAFNNCIWLAVSSPGVRNRLEKWCKTAEVTTSADWRSAGVPARVSLQGICLHSKFEPTKDAMDAMFVPQGFLMPVVSRSQPPMPISYQPVVLPEGSKKCCLKDCLTRFPDVLMTKTRERMSKLNSREKSIFLLGKISTSISTLDIAQEPTGKANKGKPRYYYYDKDHLLCRVAFETVFSIQPQQLRELLDILRQEEFEVPALPEKKRKKVEEPVEDVPPPVVLEPRKELQIIRDAMKNKCCTEDCLLKLPDELLSRTRLDLQKLPPRQRSLFLLGKISSSVSIVPSDPGPQGPAFGEYVFDRDYSICRSAFQLVYVIPDTELRLLRDRLVQDAFAFDLIIPVTEGPKRYEKPKSFNLAEEIQLVQDAAKKGCCQKQCLEKIPMELLARSRIQMKGLSSDDRHMYILGKVSTSMSLVRPGIIASERKIHQCSYSFDRSHILCKTAFEFIYTVCSAQIRRLREHIMIEGVSQLTHGLKGRPSNAKGKKRPRKAKEVPADPQAPVTYYPTDQPSFHQLL